jgi:hypothetical protein
MMDAHLDGLLDELVVAEPSEAWNDVLGRARRSRRRYAAVAVAVAVLVLTPATWGAINAFEGTPAPPDVASDFSNLVGFQRGMAAKFPQADVSKAHGVIEVQTQDGPEDLWAAPDDQGGQCYYVDWAADVPSDSFGGCEPSPPPASKIAFGDVWLPSHPTLTTFWGNVYVDAATVELTLDDGSTRTLHVVERLFLGSLEKGVKVEKVTAFDASGNVVASSATG